MVDPTFTVTVAVEAHCPAGGVNVYVAVPVLLTIAGFPVPVIPSFEVSGRIGAMVPVQIAVITVNVGVLFGLTVTLRVAVDAH